MCGEPTRVHAINAVEVAKDLNMVKGMITFDDKNCYALFSFSFTHAPVTSKVIEVDVYLRY